MNKMRVECARAGIGYERLQGGFGILEPSPLPWLGYLFWPDTERGQVTINNLQEWEFRALSSEVGTTPPDPKPAIEPTPEHRRAREQYDANHFIADLDQAINYVRAVANEEHATMVHQPHLEPGCTMRAAIYEVCATLVLRSMGAHFVGTLSLLLSKTRDMLIEKNRNYGDSALNPLRVFSQASLKEQLLVRLDDKVSRLARGSAAGEDVAQDMLGYLLLVAIAEKRERETKETQ